MKRFVVGMHSFKSRLLCVCKSKVWWVKRQFPMYILVTLRCVSICGCFERPTLRVVQTNVALNRLALDACPALPKD